jgi:hypothetical protein
VTLPERPGPARRERDGRHLEGSLQPYDVMPQHEVLIVDGDAT